MTKKPYCRHTIEHQGVRITCRRKAGHHALAGEDHVSWTPTCRIEWDDSGMVLANVGSYYSWRAFKAGRRYAVVEIDLREAR